MNIEEIAFASMTVVLLTAVGAFTQRVSGFGLGIIVMTGFPFLFATFGEATALSGLASLVLTSYIAFHYRKHIKWKLLLWPLIAYIPINYLAIWIVASSDVTLLKRALGVFLVLLSIYFIFFSSKLHIKGTPVTGVAAGGISGFLGGAFSMGGPPMVLYLLGSTDDDKTAYIASIQCFFALTGCISLTGRVMNGFVTELVLYLFPAVVLGILLGTLIGAMVYRKLNAKMLKRCVHIFMAIAGVIIFATTL